MINAWEFWEASHVTCLEVTGLMKKMNMKSPFMTDVGSVPFTKRYFMSSPRVQPAHVEVVDQIEFLMAKATNAVPCHVSPRQFGSRCRHRHRHRWSHHLIAITGDDQGRRKPTEALSKEAGTQGTWRNSPSVHKGTRLQLVYQKAPPGLQDAPNKMAFAKDAPT